MKVGLIFVSAVMVMLITLMILAWGYPEISRQVPLAVMGFTGVLVAIQITKEVQALLKKTDSVGTFQGEQGTAKADRFHGLQVLAWMIAILVLTYLLGFLVGIPLFALLYLQLHGEKWTMTAIYIVVLIAVLYGGFERGLEVYLYRGFLFE